MIGAEVQMVREGYSIRGCVDGYRNTKEVINGKERPVVEVDEKRAEFYRLMFRLRADGS